MSRYLAIDLGAESGRVIVGAFDGERIELDEVHRFANVPVRTPDGLHWDVLGIYREVLSGLRQAGARHGSAFDGVGVDSWGVDFALLDRAGRLLGNPYSYRDARTDGLPEAAARVVSAADHYTRTGIAPLQFNTIYQLMAMTSAGDQTLEVARRLLMIPDLLHYWLSGEQGNERTNASTSGALGVDGDWASELLQRLNVPTHMLSRPAADGTRLGALRDSVRQDIGLNAVPVIVPATHDTACAVVAVPARLGDGHVYLSSGTWSLLGIELARPNVSEEARLAGFTNESGARGTYRFLTNIMGLWLVQETRRTWARKDIGADWSYEELIARAAAVPSPGVTIDVDKPAFLHPDDMPAALLASLDAGDRARLAEPEALIRAILESLALAYRMTIERIERLSGTKIQVVHVVGGGSRNVLLCQLTADATGRPVLAGPAEATALGNVLIQAMGAGEIAGLEQARDVARVSAQMRRYEPRTAINWAERQARLEAARLSGVARPG